MSTRRFIVCLLCLLAFIVLLGTSEPEAANKEKHLLYVAVPGLRNYVEHGGVGILVFDIDNGYKFVKRIPTWEVPPGALPENVKGIAASAKTGNLYVSTTKRLACFDLITEKKVWEKTYDGGCDRMAVSPDGRVLYVPSLEGPHWHVVDERHSYPSTGDVIDTRTKRIVATLEDETGRHVQSEKLLEIVFAGGKPVRSGDQFGIGQKR